MHTIHNLDDIEKAGKMLKMFEKGYETIYGYEHLTFTIHAIGSHLADDAKKYGSLSQHSMFSIEGVLGIFKNYIQGSRGAPEQFTKGKH